MECKQWKAEICFPGKKKSLATDHRHRKVDQQLLISNVCFIEVHLKKKKDSTTGYLQNLKRRQKKYSLTFGTIDMGERLFSGNVKTLN